MEVAAETASKSISVQKLFLLPVSVAAILNVRCRPMSGHVASAISESGMGKNVGVAAETAWPALSAETLFPLRFWWLTFWFPDVGPCRHCHVLVGRSRKCGISVEIHL
jgi:hypothetical protein